MDELAIFTRTLDIESPEDRAAFLKQACGADAPLRARVEALLQSHQASGSFLQGSPLGGSPATMDQPPLERPGTQIGPYKLLQQIGEGGMGVVYMAEQTEPIARLVALKIIKPGMDSRQIIARFEAERQALAMMDHVNIARVLDAGTTEAGRPYFVMELVHGVPITKYCDDNRLTPRQRLELFVPVCQAIQHAHQKGIIHRDIKPSNVMVTLYDGQPVPKVIDFGVAKATEQRLTERTLFTQYGTLVGTLEYMSPEQAEMSALGVDTRSDIYSLGVLLYELLTGSTPLSSKRMKEAAYAEILRLIKEEEPPKPSTRLSESGESLASISALRHMEPAKLSKLMRGELDWIVMKTLEKDRNRRYETASGFAADVQRYLNDEQVQACPPSAWYRFRKFARRNKAAIEVAGIVLFFLVLLGSGAGWALRDREAREQEIALETDRKLALTEEGIREALDRGTKSRAELHSILKKPGGIQQLLNQPARWELLIKTAQGELAQARQLAVRAEGSLDANWTQAMDKLSQRLTSDQADYELARRLEKIRLDAATSVEGRFDYRKAADDYPKAFVGFAVLNDDPATVAARIASSPIKELLVAALDDWASIAFRTSQKGLTEELLALSRLAAPDPAWGDRLRQPKVWRDREILGKLVSETPGAGLSPQLLGLIGTLLRDVDSPQTESWLRQAQAEHPADFWLNFELANALHKTSPLEASGFYRVALAVRPGNSAVYNNLGVAMKNQQKLPEAIAACHKAIELDPKNALAHNNLGCGLKALGKLDEAIAAFHKASELDPKLALVPYNIGVVLKAQGKVKEAGAWYRKAIELDPNSALAHISLGAILCDVNRDYDGAIAAFRKAIELDPKSAVAYCNLGIAQNAQEKLDEAIAAYHKAIELDPTYSSAWAGRGWARMKRGQLDHALADQARAIELLPKERQYWNDRSVTYLKRDQLDKSLADSSKAIELDPKFAGSWLNRGEALRKLGQFETAADAYRTAIALKTLPTPDIPWAHRHLAIVLDKCGKKEDAHKQREYIVELAKQAVEQAPMTSFPWQSLGWELYRAGAWRESIEALEKSCKVQAGGTGDCGQWIVLALAHGQLANEMELSERERAQHKTEASRWYNQAVEQIGTSAIPGGDPTFNAILAFREEAAELLEVKQK